MPAWLSRADDGMRRALGRVSHLRGGVWVVLAIVAAMLLFWGAARGSSVTVDGVRYHYLDDDQMISMRYARNLRNGVPAPNVVAGVVLNRAALPGTRVAVAAAGCLPYFSRRAAVDLLGKSDRHIARLPDIVGQPTGHSRYDVSWSLRDRPDLIAAGSAAGSDSLLSEDVRGSSPERARVAVWAMPAVMLP